MGSGEGRSPQPLAAKPCFWITDGTAAAFSAAAPQFLSVLVEE